MYSIMKKRQEKYKGARNMSRWLFSQLKRRLPRSPSHPALGVIRSVKTPGLNYRTDKSVRLPRALTNQAVSFLPEARALPLHYTASYTYIANSCESAMREAQSSCFYYFFESHLHTLI